MSTHEKRSTTGKPDRRRITKVTAKRSSNSAFTAARADSLTSSRAPAAGGIKSDLLPQGQRDQDTHQTEAATAATEDVWEMAERLWSRVPDEELRKLPRDGAAQHDHYIYGTPKRAE
jgi:hypothetical protein